MSKKEEMSEDQARKILGLDSNKWTLQFEDEQLRMLKEIMRAEAARRAAVFENLLENIESFGD